MERCLRYRISTHLSTAVQPRGLGGGGGGGSPTEGPRKMNLGYVLHMLSANNLECIQACTGFRGGIRGGIQGGIRSGIRGVQFSNH